MNISRLTETGELLKSDKDESEIRQWYNALNNIYHSESMHEMLVKADLDDIDLCDTDALFWLTSTTAYHHAFWPHTAKRFTAFKNLLRKNKKIYEFIARSDKLLQKIKDELAYCQKTYGNFRPPGRVQQVKNLKQVISIIEKAREESNET